MEFKRCILVALSVAATIGVGGGVLVLELPRVKSHPHRSRVHCTLQFHLSFQDVGLLSPCKAEKEEKEGNVLAKKVAEQLGKLKRLVQCIERPLQPKIISYFGENQVHSLVHTMQLDI